MKAYMQQQLYLWLQVVPHVICHFPKLHAVDAHTKVKDKAS